MDWGVFAEPLSLTASITRSERWNDGGIVTMREACLVSRMFRAARKTIVRGKPLS